MAIAFGYRLQSYLATTGNGSVSEVFYPFANGTCVLLFLTTISNIARVFKSKFCCKNHFILLRQKTLLLPKCNTDLLVFYALQNHFFCITDAKVYIANCCHQPLRSQRMKESFWWRKANLLNKDSHKLDTRENAIGVVVPQLFCVGGKGKQRQKLHN